MIWGGQPAEGTCAAVELSDGERDALLQLCRMRLDAFRQQRGDDVFAHRSRHRTPISGSVKYRVLTRAKSRCECCNAGKRDTDSTDFRGMQASYARRERRCVPCRPT